jgi:hypothetical protein
MFRALYESPLYDPVLFWIAGAAFVIAIARRMPFLYAYLVVFALEILADATLTGPWSPVGSTKILSTAVPLAFVILGDARYFVIVERAALGSERPLRAWLGALGFAFVVPVVSYIPQLLWPRTFEGRSTYLLYELLFAGFAIALRVWLPRRLAGAAEDDRRWAIRATHFELAQYALWATADILILSGFDGGYALRLVPNTMYYVLFLPFVAWTAPRALALPWSNARA